MAGKAQKLDIATIDYVQVELKKWQKSLKPKWIKADSDEDWAWAAVNAFVDAYSKRLDDIKREGAE
jgi:hypothetical protein